MPCTIEIRRYGSEWAVLPKEWAVVIVDPEHRQCYKFKRHDEDDVILEENLTPDGTESHTFTRKPLGQLSNLEEALRTVRETDPDEEDLEDYPRGQGWVIFAILNLAEENLIVGNPLLADVLERLRE